MLVTLDNTKTYLGIPLLTTTYDTFLTQQIEIISEAIENYCQRSFNSASYTQTFYKDEFQKDQRVMDLLPLYHFPVISIASVTVKADELDTGTAYTDYRLHKPTGWLNKKQYEYFFTEGEIIEVVYTAGYATIPKTIENAVYSLVSERYNKKINGIDLNFGSDVQSISIPGTISIAYDYSLQDNERKTAFGAILGKYVNTLDYFRSERAIVGDVRLAYL